jgi:DNA-binding TFAR19-related protein (PDSD5 family)
LWPPPLSECSAVANIALVKADKARKIEDLLIMNAQRGAASRIIAAGVVTCLQV